MNSLYIYGASGHGLVVSDIARICGYDDIIFCDDGENQYPTFEEIKHMNHIPIALGIGTNKIRKMIFKKLLRCNFKIVTLIHKSSIISPSATIGIGTVIMPNVVVNANTKVGKGVILNSSCVVEHENIIGDFVHISPKVGLAGDVNIGNLAQIGIGSNVIQGIKIGKKSLIGANSTVVNNIGKKILAYGSPCKKIKRL